MGRDLVSSPYGRFFHLPRILSERGHDVRVVLLDYRAGPPLDERVENVRLISTSIYSYRAELRRQMADDPADWVIGFSDTYFGILAVRLAKRFSRRACIDAYDNYESYVPWCYPLHWLWRNSLTKADLVTAAGPDLVEKLSASRQETQHSAVVPMAADPSFFATGSQSDSRKLLGLPQEGKLVGYCGSLHQSRGVDTLFRSIDSVKRRDPEIRFYHSGRTWKNVELPETLHSLGYLPDDHVPHLLRAMDTLVVVNRDSEFGRYSYPVKLYEAMACGVPAVATRTPATEWIMAGHADRLVPPSDPEALAATIVRSLNDSMSSYGRQSTWESSCDLFERALVDASARTPGTLQAP